MSTDRPEPGLGEILVRVRAAGVNPVDWRTRLDGGLGTLGSPPFVLGWDVAGTVEATGRGVTLFEPGDRVMGMPRFPNEAGAYAEFATGPARHFVHVPERLSFIEAAALPLAGLTAWQALTDTAMPLEGRHVLIHGAAGGVGHLAVQIAAARGAKVTATARTAHHERLRALGADEVINCTDTELAAAVAPVDTVIDTIGGACTIQSLQVLGPGGTLVTLPGPPCDAVLQRAGEAGKRLLFMLVEPDRTGLLALSDLVDRGQLMPAVAAMFPLAGAAQAHLLAEAGGQFGKTVLEHPQP
ncbi:NADP-dependent oxidoreductase [Streptomyces mirabilis]|uniref:NADP-dependent oxidoreductase n=1 Tax=Streptomyces mirabilis TaxID=68239 RepID=UPI00225386A1|nr:NADP-dependent oxidoreductase [Streptomyces mirabilis]MCX4617734.1 NADP-dependent oxidoreductase [Streptomyces mirabilis]